MSTGQKQLISFARALAHDPKSLCWTKPPPASIRKPKSACATRLPGWWKAARRSSLRTVSPPIQRADKIIVMHKGHVREIGTHQQLLAQRGIYWKLYQLQYKDQELGVPQSQVGADD